MSTLTLYDFNKTSNIADWLVVNDGVMGGLSRGTMELSTDGHGVFRGKLSLENNGGFSSIRHSFSTKKVSDFDHIRLKVKGDGKRYQLRIKSRRSQYYSYVAYFETNGEWETISVPIREMYPVFRGNRLNQPNYEGVQIEEIGILIANKKAEAFRLEIDSIYLQALK
ncbi:CIA30 family protein [Lentiprolixibacter aurantiacus]|uniref:CIA30 family protein n=1 Tax=Lentiprolixibacter aurantiacus TaxID=2993939 RepID=A0AAE3MN88_9FLAO|nr:CIA30 family protein [Lentiprolixibacter aurantiacus]MCX2719992.1 CIA30 family protein [Lentiprolixibacter aurantiacus]